MNVVLDIEIEKFKKWASAYPIENRSGEWECDYDCWNDIYAAFTEYLESNSPEGVSEVDFQNLLYVIARDNEIEDLARTLSEHKEWLKAVVFRIPSSEESDAKWQIAKVLGNAVLPKEESEEVLLKLVFDDHEYVSRMALQSLGKIGSTRAESLCERAWQSNDEYQRIMALWVLHKIGSGKLQKYLQLAFEDGRKYVVMNANEIKSA